MGEGSSHLGIKFPSILFLHMDAFTYKGFYTGRGLHTETVLRREMISQRDASIYLQVLLHRDTFNTEMLLHTGALRYIYIYLRRDDFANAGTFTQRCFYTGVFTC